MKTSETILANFINDFNLEVPGIGVCFEAAIEFATDSLFKQFNCEVQIITMTEKKLSIIYLLHQELADYGIPDTFPFDAGNFFYSEMKSLIITDYDLLRGKYSLTISPVTSNCAKQPTLLSL